MSNQIVAFIWQVLERKGCNTHLHAEKECLAQRLCSSCVRLATSDGQVPSRLRFCNLCAGAAKAVGLYHIGLYIYINKGSSSRSCLLLLVVAVIHQTLGLGWVINHQSRLRFAPLLPCEKKFALGVQNSPHVKSNYDWKHKQSTQCAAQASGLLKMCVRSQHQIQVLFHQSQVSRNYNYEPQSFAEPVCFKVSSGSSAANPAFMMPSPF